MRSRLVPLLLPQSLSRPCSFTLWAAVPEQRLTQTEPAVLRKRLRLVGSSMEVLTSACA